MSAHFKIIMIAILLRFKTLMKSIDRFKEAAINLRPRRVGKISAAEINRSRFFSRQNNVREFFSTDAAPSQTRKSDATLICFAALFNELCIGLREGQ